MLTSSLFADMDTIRHGFFTRDGGHSEGIYASLNCGPGSSDDPDRVAENRKQVAAAMGVAPPDLVTLYQVHSPTIVVVEQPWGQGDAPRADAMICATPGIALGILTADCVPVLFADPEAGIIAAAHAGWKGAAGGVLEASVTAMAERGSDVAHIRAVVGPCIHQPSYEVDDRFRDAIVTLNNENTQFFMQGVSDDHFQFDLPGYVRSRLERTGIGHIDDLSIDTYADEDRFFSYRRTTHRKEPDYGRQISVIALAMS